MQVTAPNLNNGTPTDIAYDAGPQASDYLSKTWINGPNNIITNDASIFKVFPITERTSLRVNMDVFNAMNVQGYNNPGSDGIEQVQPGVGVASSHNAPRVLQFTMRLTF